jgi:hypothetical protein
VPYPTTFEQDGVDELAQIFSGGTFVLENVCMPRINTQVVRAADYAAPLIDDKKDNFMEVVFDAADRFSVEWQDVQKELSKRGAGKNQFLAQRRKNPRPVPYRPIRIPDNF